ncbi:replication initiator protein A [Mesorhizobium sp. CO1-1-11]|uniref:replication initiator protein A n=1 Tax=Mesorhizobium sp. CO1-1-11 TaxID=2876636 RepID=UPI001CC9E516|nr:replication initiator protein A [Mesorhizobium sp. CO1-1-11]MBZ9725353.1 replication initiator protein A [Mesorhizobium sp. CO1-1-11]
MRPTPTDLEPIALFHARPGKMALRDAQDLMAWPFFSLAKSRRITPIDFRMGEIAIRVEATIEHGMATIWDADILIWAASQIVDARDKGLGTSRMMAATPHEILTFIGRGTSAREYLLLKAALDRLQSTTVATSIRQPTERRMHRFSWINEWKERADHRARPLGIELVLPDWFYAGIMVEFPSGIGQGEMPPLFVIGPSGGSELVNYRARQNYYVVDRLFAAAELRLGDKTSEKRVRIVRTDGRKPQRSVGLFR